MPERERAMFKSEPDDRKVLRTRTHQVVIENRERVVISGVEDVDSFNEEEVVLLTEAGVITLIGQELHVNKLNLDEGQLIVEGFFMGLDYRDHEVAHKGLFGKIFK